MRLRTVLRRLASNRVLHWTAPCLLAVACLAASDIPSPPLPSGLLIAPGWVTVEPGATVRLTASLVFTDGDTVEVSSAATWSATRTAVVSVDSNGRVTGLEPGIDTVVAAVGPLGGYAVIVVGPPVLVGAGDIADCGLTSAAATATLLDAVPGVVFTAGDNAYQDGTLSNYEQCYDPTWGRHRARTRPTPGNHDYHTPGAWPYFEYFGRQAGDSGKGYYSYEVGSWHVIALNSNIARGQGSPQEQWLRADLAAHPNQCTMAYWHFPRFSSGVHGDDTSMTAFWRALFDAGAEIVVSGHDHIYERFAPQTYDGTADGAHGIRQFVVGTGGGALTNVTAVQPNSEVRIAKTFGVLELTLAPGHYAWRFVPVSGGTAADSGSADCH